MSTQQHQHKDSGSAGIVKVAVPVPLRKSFDYRSSEPLTPGTRVLVPFSGRTLVGMVVPGEPDPAPIRRKSVKTVLDETPLLPDSLLELVLWAARYYQHPLGEVIHTALPAWLRSANPVSNPDLETRLYRNPEIDATDAARDLRRAPKQRLVFNQVPTSGGITARELRQRLPEIESSALSSLGRKLLKRGLLISRVEDVLDAGKTGDESLRQPFQGALNSEQQAAINQVVQSLGNYRSFVLQGITGSGKTEVYLHVSEQVIRRGGQVLVLVPEIGLTPQLVQRYRNRLGNRIDVLHSAMTDRERYRTWFRAREGTTSVVLGTRSALFTPLRNPGLIIVDEEHDQSFKQMDGFRYHARDLAVMRASMEEIPIVLGSATPSMETHRNAEAGKFSVLSLQQRVGDASLPVIDIVDTRAHKSVDGLTGPLTQAIGQRLDIGQQVILYVNRRGYAPITQCGDCGWQATCSRCDAYLTYHAWLQKLLCHYCGHSEPGRETCPQCGAAIFFSGLGTQRVQQALEKTFPNARLLRFDRDVLSTQAKLKHAIDQVNEGFVDIIVGTQLISKGHDFPNVTLVGILAPDQGLFSVDFRAPELLFQQLVQVSGRAGRGSEPGQVIIQTAFPDNSYLGMVRDHRFQEFYQLCGDERAALGFPPFGYLAMLRAESTERGQGLAFLGRAKSQGQEILAKSTDQNVQIMDPVASPMEKQSGRFRAQLLVKSRSRHALGQFLEILMSETESSPASRRVRWSLDVDPIEMY